ncbi:MAG TPA: SurA N-terminal domain-containing protein, partial [Gammaproteobacteria bacterium]|nr:SurA N-terminal domain-containing protein [Gammaproteobacteria bacterium]
MLQAIHDRVTGWIAKIIVGLIIIVFALWGVDSYLKNDARVYAAMVNDVEITIPEYRFAKQQQTQRMRNMLGEQFDSGLVNTAEFKSAVLNRLVEEELLVQAATTAGFAISDGLLAAQIHAIPDFQEDGKFSQKKYQQLLSQQGLNTQSFEQQYRRSLLINQYLGGLSGTAVVARQNVEQGMRLQGQERKLRYLRVPVARYQDKVEVKPEAVSAFYESNKARFMEPEQVKLQYLELSLDSLTKGLTATDAEIEQMYASEKERLTVAEQRRARHILIKAEEGASKDAVAGAQKQAEDLVKRLRAGEDFAKLAKEFSQDPGSAAEGGDLGLFGKGMMVPEFDEATFSLAKDTISDPVRSPFGFHIIQVTEIQAAKIPDLAEAREQIVEDVLRKQAEALFFERSETLGKITFEHPDTLATAAEQLGLTVQETGFMPTTGGEGIGSHPQVMEAVLAEDVLTGGNNSGVIEIAPNHVVVARVLERKAESQLALDAVRETIQNTLRQQAMRDAVSKQGADWLKQLNSGATLEGIAAEIKAEIQ